MHGYWHRASQSQGSKTALSSFLMRLRSTNGVFSLRQAPLRDIQRMRTQQFCICTQPAVQRTVGNGENTIGQSPAGLLPPLAESEALEVAAISQSPVAYH